MLSSSVPMKGRWGALIFLFYIGVSRTPPIFTMLGFEYLLLGDFWVGDKNIAHPRTRSNRESKLPRINCRFGKIRGRILPNGPKILGKSSKFQNRDFLVCSLSPISKKGPTTSGACTQISIRVSANSRFDRESVCIESGDGRVFYRRSNPQ